MTLCVNPKCTQPENPDHHLYCHTCGSELLLEGLYRVSKKLGEGGFGVTYIVKDTHNNIEKVLKILTLDDPNALRLFEQEAEALKKLNHPGIPQVESDGYFIYFARDSQEPIHCLIMEKIEGEDLETWLNKRQKPINQRVALNWLKELTEILQVVHQEQFFHRDIKPSNIMLKPDGKLALIDFGTVKEATQTYMAKAEAGRPGTIAVYSKDYAPTEQQNGHPVPQSDFFALGRTFVHLLTKQRPLQFYDPHTDSLNWQDAATKIDPLLKDFIDQLMKRLYKDRPANTTVILQELEKIERKLYPLKVTPKPTVIQSPPKQISSQKQSIKKKNQPIKKIQWKKIPWGWLTGMVIICGIIGAVSSINSIPWWSWVLVIAPLWIWEIVCVNFHRLGEYVLEPWQSIMQSVFQSNIGAIGRFVVVFVMMSVPCVPLFIFPWMTHIWISTLSSTSSNFISYLLGALSSMLSWCYFPFTTFLTLLYDNEDRFNLHSHLILNASFFGGLGLGVLIVWLWQYLI